MLNLLAAEVEEVVRPSWALAQAVEEGEAAVVVLALCL